MQVETELIRIVNKDVFHYRRYKLGTFGPFKGKQPH